MKTDLVISTSKKKNHTCMCTHTQGKRSNNLKIINPNNNLLFLTGSREIQGKRKC